jgi:hypothetical protein
VSVVALMLLTRVYSSKGQRQLAVGVCIWPTANHLLLLLLVSVCYFMCICVMSEVPSQSDLKQRMSAVCSLWMLKRGLLAGAT